MHAGAERRREDLARLAALAAASGGRVALVSSSGDPPAEVNVQLAFRTAGSDDFPSSVVGQTRARISLPARYPFEPPLVYLTPITFHPNVFSSGLVCLGAKWLPTEGLALLVKRIARIITFDPTLVNAASAANPAAAMWYRRSKEQHPDWFPSDSVEALSGWTSRPKPRWRDIVTEANPRTQKTIQCEKCSQHLRVPDVAGAQVRCPRCLHIFRVAA